MYALTFLAQSTLDIGVVEELDEVCLRDGLTVNVFLERRIVGNGLETGLGGIIGNDVEEKVSGIVVRLAMKPTISEVGKGGLNEGCKSADVSTVNNTIGELPSRDHCK